MQRIIVVHNPRSSKQARVENEVLAKLRTARGVAMGRYEVRDTDVDDNAERLAQILRDKDIVVAAGGDGTATIAMNGCMLSGKDVSFAALAYGNFNDLARISGVSDVLEMVEDGKRRRRGKLVEAWPLEIIIDGKHWRYALGYVTMGLFAESTVVFDEAGTRKKLKSGKKKAVFSWLTLAKWYFTNRKRKGFMPRGFELNREIIPESVTDYVAMNAPRMGGVMRGRNWFLDKEEFCSGVAELGSFWKLAALMLRSMVYKAPVRATKGDELVFPGGAEVMIQAEGEYELIRGERIEVRKAERSLKILRYE